MHTKQLIIPSMANIYRVSSDEGVRKVCIIGYPLNNARVDFIPWKHYESKVWSSGSKGLALFLELKNPERKVSGPFHIAQARDGAITLRPSADFGRWCLRR